GGTLLLTTHFMDEAQYLCDRLAIIDHGQVLVQGNPTELIGTLGGGHVVVFAADRALSLDELGELAGVTAAVMQDGSYRLTTREPHRAVAAVFGMIGARGGELTALSTHQATLDDVFLAQTGRQLRDE